MIRVKRVYDPPEEGDGYRILVDRLWPRGLTKEAAALDMWLKTVAPSDELRRWTHQDPEKWTEFCGRYNAELDTHPNAIAFLRQKSKDGWVTLLYAHRDERHNNAVALAAYLRS
ncbi:DUF488 domain-containing protein [Inquilinus sp.]|jgi:uncharacterized protein YeaO (DUF488 family)|uniref:DUF488 domain-containing protein n=1 Tax=Inquilinus sp. TaxID=1932117 RepID=UPI003783C5E1